MLWLRKNSERKVFGWTRRARIVVLNYPSNPTGATYTPEELRDIAEVARGHRVVLLSDEIYGKLHYEGEHSSIVPLYPEGTIFSGGLSKWCGAGGWRLSFCTGLRYRLNVWTDFRESGQRHHRRAA